MSKVFEALENARLSIAIGSANAVDTPTTRRLSATLSAVPADFSRVDLEEEMVRLHQSIRGLLPGRSSRVIQFVAAQSGEGTSTVARELARVAATRFDERVLLVEGAATFSRQTTHDITLTSDGVRQVGNIPLFVADTRAIADMCTDRDASSPHAAYEFVVIDTPATPWSLPSKVHVDGFLLVIAADGTRWPVVETLKQNIERQGGTVLGVVLNKRRYYIPKVIYRAI
jgi:Mrp family chromosome partitioning ATPase